MIINLISGPRNISTALMYAFAQRSDCRVVDEPFYGCYLQETGAQHPGRAEVLNAQPRDPQTVIRRLKEKSNETPVLFIKNMAHHLQFVDRSFFKQVQHVFLIRNPAEMIVSFIKKIPNPTLRDTAYQDQYQQFEYLTKTLNRVPVVLDASELLKDPPAVLQNACEALAIEYDKQMLRWSAGPIPEDGVWAIHWYHNVHQSTGFKPYKPKNETVPQRLQPLLEKCREFYDPLFEQAIKAPA